MRSGTPHASEQFPMTQGSCVWSATGAAQVRALADINTIDNSGA